MGLRDNLFNLDDFVPDGGYPYPWPPEECYVEEEPELEDEILFEMDEYKNTKWCECPNCHKKLSKKTLEQNEHECPYCGEIIFMDLLW